MEMAKEKRLNRIKETRESKGMTRYELAKRTGLWYVSLVKIENNKTDIKLSSIIKIAEALECSIADLV